MKWQTTQWSDKQRNDVSILITLTAVMYPLINLILILVALLDHLAG